MSIWVSYCVIAAYKYLNNLWVDTYINNLNSQFSLCSCCCGSSCLADSWLLEVRLPDDFVRLTVPGQLAALSSGSGPRSGLLINLCKFLHSEFWSCILLLMDGSSSSAQVAVVGESLSSRDTHVERNYIPHRPVCLSINAHPLHCPQKSVT